MIKTIGQAKAVQHRRFTKGKKGIAKAVRRYFRKEWLANHDEDFAPWRGYFGMPADFVGCRPHDEVHGYKA